MIDKRTPVLLLGGKENSLSIARNLGRMGIAVRVSGAANCLGMYSRFCAERLPVPGNTPQPDHWKRLLLGSDRRLDGHIAVGAIVLSDSKEPPPDTDESYPELPAHFAAALPRETFGRVTYEVAVAPGVAPVNATPSWAQQIIMKIVTEDAEPVTRARKNVPPNVAAAVGKAGGTATVQRSKFSDNTNQAPALGISLLRWCL